MNLVNVWLYLSESEANELRYAVRMHLISVESAARVYTNANQNYFAQRIGASSLLLGKVEKAVKEGLEENKND